MKKYVKKIFEIVLVQIISFVLLVWAIVFAALMWPSNTPDWETVWWKFINFFENLKWDCPNGKVLWGINTDWTKICID